MSQERAKALEEDRFDMLEKIIVWKWKPGMWNNQELIKPSIPLPQLLT